MDKNKLVDFLTEKIFDESLDSSTYLEVATNQSNANIKSVLSDIAEEERQHQKVLIKLLGDIAKGLGDD